ncbi:MAG: putative YigZ family protein [Bradymonadia bacterium]
MSEPAGRRTLSARHVEEIPKVKGSRFWATVDRCARVEGALAVVDALRTQWPDATHHCWAWRGEGRDAWRYADDGEPSGSAGKPILSAIDGRDLTDVVVVVTRYFGGTKLGVGGLIRAYGGCAAAALDAASIVFVPDTTTIRITHPYELSGSVQSVLTAHGYAPSDAEYGAEVCVRIVVPDAGVESFLFDLGERCAGRAQIEVLAD